MVDDYNMKNKKEKKEKLPPPPVPEWFPPDNATPQQVMTDEALASASPATSTKSAGAVIDGKIVAGKYPSPAEASAADLLKLFFDANLRIQTDPLSGKNILPYLISDLQKAENTKDYPDRNIFPSQHKNALEHATQAHPDAIAAYDALTRMEELYKKKIAAGGDRDTIALGIIKILHDGKEGKPNLQDDGMSPGHLLAPKARGNGVVHNYGETAYNGSAGQLFKYFEAVERNRVRYVQGSSGPSQSYSEFFAKTQEEGYKPDGKDISPASVPSVADGIAGLQEVIDADRDALRKVMGYSRNSSVSGRQGPSDVERALKELKEDVARDNILGANKGSVRKLDSLYYLMQGLDPIHYDSLPVETKQSYERVKAAYENPRGNHGNHVGTPVNKNLAQDLAVVVNSLTWDFALDGFNKNDFAAHHMADNPIEPTAQTFPGASMTFRGNPKKPTNPR